jgi:OmpA-OmpF porin, OOP family
MMRKRQFYVLVLAVVLGLTVSLGLAQAQEKCSPKVDNFVFFVDQSGSMYMTWEGKDVYRGHAFIKERMAKQLLGQMNELIPQLKYNGGLSLFAPFQQLLVPAPYDRAQMGKAITSIKDSQEIFGRLTPMGPGFDSLDPAVLAKLSGKTAVILVTDGMHNLGKDPVAEARALYSKYSNLCIHIVSFADQPAGKKILEDINKLNACSILVSGPELLQNRAALEKFVMDVFCAPLTKAKEEVLILRGIHFDFDKAIIKPEWKVVLDEGASTLMKRPEVSVVIEGHCDGIGSVPYNQKLSERRARAVYDYFVKKGVKKNRMQTIGYGKSRPKADNATDEGRAINRRVELKVVQ